MYNVFIGNNELRIIAKSGNYQVIEEWENWKTVFSGNYSDCVKYCDNRYIDYVVNTQF